MDWYKLSPEDIFEKLKTSKGGLSTDEAVLRLEKNGLNILPRQKQFRALLFLWSQFKSPLIFILLIAGFITLGIKEYFDMIIIFASVIVNIGIGFYQEYSSGKILEKLARMVRVEARVKRSGTIKILDSEQLVVGDIVYLKAGMKVPADLRLISIKDLSTSEALLTGESNPIEKDIVNIDIDSVIGDRKNMAFMGTIVEKGECTGVVVGTGVNTEIGKIAELTKKADDDLTPLQERLNHLGKIISIIVVISATIIIGIGLYTDIGFIEIFITSVAVAVAAIPEGLPAALAVILAVGSQRILKKGGLVKRLVAAESLGSTSVICVDKTGTLTEGMMKVEKIITKSSEDKIIRTMALANEALVEYENGEYIIKGDSTDQAKTRAFLDSGESLGKLRESLPQINFIPFDSENKYVASFHKLNDGTISLFVSGAPELFMDKSTNIEVANEVRLLNDTDRDEIRLDYETMAKDGFRMIGAGYKEFKADMEDISNMNEVDLKKLVNNLVFLGLVAIRDPIRKEVKGIMKEVKSAGLKVVMITGDHKLTALAIGRELGIAGDDENSVIEGKDLDKISDEELREKIRGINIFARVDPIHKLRVTKAWKEIGESVAVTGDGINDAPALKTADIGIALASGTDVTKDTADLVLVDNSFATIIEAIKQGRTAFSNIKKVVIFLLSNSFTEVILILGALLLRIPLPMTAVQILWTNLVEDGLPNFALAFEPPEKRVMERKPIKRKKPLLDAQGKFLAYPLGIMTDVILLGIFIYLYKYTSYELSYIRTFIFAILGTDSLFYIFGLKSLDKSVFKTNPFNNTYLLISIGIGFAMMLIAIYLPQMNLVLKTSPLAMNHLAIVAGLGFYKLLVVELTKWIYNRRTAN